MCVLVSLPEAGTIVENGVLWAWLDFLTIYIYNVLITSKVKYFL